MSRLSKAEIVSFSHYIEPFMLPLDQQGLVLVEGPNGSGKSMLFEPIAWALTGKMFRHGDRKLGADDVCWNGHPADVGVFFDAGNDVDQDLEVVARRVRQPNGSPTLTLYPVIDGMIGDPMRGQGVHADDATETLDRLLGFDFRTLRSALFVQSKGLDVAASTFAKQMELLESVLRFDEFTRGRERADAKAKSIAQAVQRHIDSLGSWSNAAEQARSTLQGLESLDESEREDTILNRLREIKRQTAGLPALRQQIDEADRHERETREAHETARQHRLTIHTQWERMSTLANAGKCTTCERDFDPKIATQIAASAKSRLDLAVSEGQRLLAEYESAKIETTKLARQEDALNVLVNEQRGLERELEHLRERADRRQTLIDEQRARLDECEHEVGRLTNLVAHDQRTLHVAQNWSKRDFEAMKQETLAAAAPVLNHAADVYANALSDGFLSLEFVTIRASRNDDVIRIRRNGQSVRYEALSDGEQRRVDLIVAFSLRSCARWRMPTPLNVCVWDEVFDKLDEDGLRRAIDVLLQDVEEIGSVFVITHRTDMRALLPGSRTITVRRDQRDVSHVLGL